jgi:iron complex outermembrane receptor protein
MIDFNAPASVVESRRFKARIGVAICLAMGTAVSFSGVAMAQQAQSAAPTDDQLQEVIVTAERRTVDLQKTAVTMSVRTGDDLAEQGKFAVSEILEDVPNVVVAVATIGNATGVSDSPASRISIRGVGANGRPPGSATSVVPGVAEYVDGVYNGVGDTYDISRVEVLRGPQGTLYGRSATGGVVAIHTIDPVAGEFNGTASAEFGNYNLRHYSAGVNLPLGSEAALRVSGNDYSRDGYYATKGGALHTTDGRVKLLLKPTDNLTILAGVALQNNIERTGELGGSMNAAGKIEYTQVLPLGTGHDDTRQYWAQVDWNLGPATLTYIPALRDWTMHGTVFNSPAPGATLTNQQATPTDRFVTHELRLASNAGSPIKWQAGAFYYDNKATATVNLVVSGPFFPPGGILLQNSVTSHKTTNTGAFAEAGFPLTSSLSLTAGVRFDKTKVVTGETNTTGLGAGGTLVLPESDGTRNWNNTTYKLRLEDNLTDNNLLYASVSTAFLPGDVAISTGSTGALAISPYEAETLTAFEVGSKNRFLNDRFQVNGAVFYYRYGGYQQSVQTGSLPGGIFLFSYANSPAKMTGAELELLYQPHRSDRFGLNISVLNPYYVDKTPVFAVGVSQSKIPGIVPLTVNPSYSHIFTIGDTQTLTVQADALYNSDYDVYAMTAAVAAQGGAPYIKAGSHVVANLSAAWAFTSKASLTFWARNLTDQQSNSYVNISSVTPALRAAGTLRDPRSVGVSFRVGF